MHGSEAIRKRPGMYIGSTSQRGLHQAVFEVTNRAVNEVLAGRAGVVDVVLTPGGGVSVADDGPGVPVEAAGDSDGPGLEALLTRMDNWREPVGRNAALVGFVSVGPCVTNALSSRLSAEVRRGGTHWVQKYAHGVAVAPPIAAGPATGTGTTIVFWPDADIFETVECSFDVLAERFRELAFLNRSLHISLTDTRPSGEPRSMRFRFPGGVRDFITSLDVTAGTSAHPDVIHFEWENPQMEGRAEVALRWRDSREERVLGFANSRPTHGGTHLAGFRDGMAAAVNAYARDRGLLAATNPDLSAGRIGDGLTAVVSVKLDRPEFEGATPSVLGNTAVGTCVEEGMREYLGRWLEEHPEQAAIIVGRIAGNVRRS
nr:DNA gyrase subunit B [Streptomyces sp. CBMA29]